MDIKKYVGTLKGVIEKDDVLSALETVNQDLGMKVLPILSTTNSAIKVNKFTSEFAIGYDGHYRSAMSGVKGNLFSDLETRLGAVQTNLRHVRSLIEKTVPDTVSSSAIDYRSAVLMQLVDNASFLMRFIRRFTEAVVIHETQVTGIYDTYSKDNLNKGEEGWIQSRFPSFLSTLTALSMDEKQFLKKYEDIPNVKVDQHSDTDHQLFGKSKMDPFMLGFIPLAINPFFIVGRWIVEFQAWRYKEAQEDLARIQKRILLLEEANAGKGNPKLEKELEILRDKAETITYKINKAEEDL